MCCPSVAVWAQNKSRQEVLQHQLLKSTEDLLHLSVYCTLPEKLRFWLHALSGPTWMALVTAQSQFFLNYFGPNSAVQPPAPPPPVIPLLKAANRLPPPPTRCCSTHTVPNLRGRQGSSQSLVTVTGCWSAWWICPFPHFPSTYANEE